LRQKLEIFKHETNLNIIKKLLSLLTRKLQSLLIQTNRFLVLKKIIDVHPVFPLYRYVCSIDIKYQE